MGKNVKYIATGMFLLFAASLSPWAYDFPLNDDWAYALAARALAETGRLTYCDWGSATQIPHLVWGALVIKFFGFSFATLRAANLVIAAAALFVFVKLLDEFDIPPAAKLLSALALGLNPLYLTLSASFMTDLHYLFWMLSASLFYVRRLKDPDSGEAGLWLAGACAAAGYLTRQLALALPLAFSVVLLSGGGVKWRVLARAWALPAAAMLGFHFWFKCSHGPTWASENYVGAATLAHLSRPGAFLGDSLYRLLAVLAQSGLLLLPAAAGFLFSARQFACRNGFRHKIASAVPWAVILALGVFAMACGPLPYLENTLSASGLGVLTLGGAALKPSGIFAYPAFWYVMTALAAIAAAQLLCASALSLRAGGPGLRFLCAAALFHLALSMAGAKFFDRYLLTLLPCLAAAAAFASRGVRFSAPASAAALALYALLGWTGVKDYMAWNRAKWELSSRPREALQPAEIAAGFDHNAWLNYQPNMAYLKSMKPLKMIGEWEWQKIVPFRAIISYAPDPRLKLLDQEEYSTPLSSRKGKLYLMQLPPLQ